MNITIGNLIKEKRIQLGYSQEYLSKLMGYKSRSSIFNIEKDITIPSNEQLKKFSKILNIPLSTFFNCLIMETEEIIFNNKTILFLIYNDIFTLNENDRNILLKKCNIYYNSNLKFFETLNLPEKTYMPLTEYSKDKEILGFAFKYKIIDNVFLDSIKDNTKLDNLEYKENDLNMFFSNYYNNAVLTLFNNMDIKEIQKKIINIITEIIKRDISTIKTR